MGARSTRSPITSSPIRRLDPRKAVLERRGEHLAVVEIRHVDGVAAAAQRVGERLAPRR